MLVSPSSESVVRQLHKCSDVLITNESEVSKVVAWNMGMNSVDQAGSLGNTTFSSGLCRL